GRPPAPAVRARGGARTRQAVDGAARLLQPGRQPRNRRPLRGSTPGVTRRTRLRPTCGKPLLGVVVSRLPVSVLRTRRLGHGAREPRAPPGRRLDGSAALLRLRAALR